MKNKGFTLIELLAVIVILAIIALIATPIVLNIIKDSKNSSIERSAELYLSQVKNEIARYNMIHPGSNFNPSECIVQSDNTLNCDGTIIAISIDGTKPNSGSTILLSNGTVTSLKDFIIDGKNISLVNGNYKVSDSSNKAICEAVTTATTGNVPSGNFNYGDEYTCHLDSDRTFFVLETNGDNVLLIMDRNFTDDTVPTTLAWCIGVNEPACKNINSKEEGTPLKHIQDTFGTNVEVSFPSASQIATASGKTFDENSGASELSAWLYNYLYNTTNPVSDVYGYWTSTPENSDFTRSWHMDYGGNLEYYGLIYGIRPVITVSKSMIG